MSQKPFVRRVLNVVLPVAGFGVGWLGFAMAEDQQWIAESTQRKLNVANLKMQVKLQRLLPASVVEKYGYEEEMLQSMIDSLEKGYTEQAMNDRVTFDQVLSECDVPEQIGFLEEHASEDIPYFYIADIFHSWARLHDRSIVHAEKKKAPKKVEPQNVSDQYRAEAGPLVLRNNKDFDSEILCEKLWEKMIQNVIPFDVSVRALCVLAVNNQANRKRLSRIGNADDVLACYERYTEKLREEADSAEDDVVDKDEVYAATVFYLRAVNDAAVHRRWVPGIGQPSTGPFPLASRVDADRWCAAFAPSVTTPHAQELMSETAALFADVMADRLKCAERPLHSTE